MEMVTRRHVELAKIGNWSAVTGPVDLTPEKLNAMVEASRADWWDGSPIGIGHFDKRFLMRRHRDGEPALGAVQNLIVEDDSLFGDLVNVPTKLAEIIPFAYPRRSIKWEEDYTAPDGTTYAAVLRGLDLLGVQDPDVAGLAPIEDLDDVYELFAASKDEESGLTIAYVGADGPGIVEHLSALDRIIHAPHEKTMHDIDALQLQSSSDNQGDSTMADTIDLDSKLREMLSVSDEADLLEEIRKLQKPAAETTTPTEPPAGTGDDDEEEDEEIVEPPKTTEETTAVATPADIPESPRPYIEDLAAKANAGYEAARLLREQTVDRQLKAASKAGQLTPVEYGTWREFMLESDANLNRGTKMLSERPKVMNTSEIGSAVDESNKVSDDDGYEAWNKEVFGGRV